MKNEFFLRGIQNLKHQSPESSPGSLIWKILQKICITLKLLIFYNSLTDPAQRQILGPQRSKLREKILSLGWFNSRFLPGVCWAETGNLKCLKCSFSPCSWPNKSKIWFNPPSQAPLFNKCSNQVKMWFITNYSHGGISIPTLLCWFRWELILLQNPGIWEQNAYKSLLVMNASVNENSQCKNTPVAEDLCHVLKVIKIPSFYW